MGTDSVKLVPSQKRDIGIVATSGISTYSQFYTTEEVTLSTSTKYSLWSPVPPISCFQDAPVLSYARGACSMKPFVNQLLQVDLWCLSEWSIGTIDPNPMSTSEMRHIFFVQVISLPSGFWDTWSDLDISTAPRPTKTSNQNLQIFQIIKRENSEIRKFWQMLETHLSSYLFLKKS